MPDTLTPFRPAPSGGDHAAAADVPVWDHVARTVAWLDANRHDPRDPAARVAAIAADVGQTAAWIATSRQRPGTDEDALAGKLCDLVLAALVALTTVTGGTPQAEARLAQHVVGRTVWLRYLEALS